MLILLILPIKSYVISVLAVFITQKLRILQDHAILRHFKDKMNRGLERGTTIRSKLTQPTQSQLHIPTKLNIKRILQVIDGNLNSDTVGTKSRLRSKLNEIDGKIWLYETAQSGSNGGAVRGYVNDSYRPLDWVDVKSLRDEIIPAVEQLNAQRHSQLNQASYYSHSYGTVADDDGADARSDYRDREGSEDEATFANVL